MSTMRRTIFCCILCTAIFLYAKAAEQTPASWQEKLLGDKLIYADKTEVNTTEHLKGKIVALYFSFNGCGFCRKFNPKLRKMYRNLQKSGAPFEIVLVSLDETPAGMRTMMEEEDMLWPAMPFQYARSHKISKKYHAYGAPILVVLDSDGELLCKDGRYAVEREGRMAYYAWRIGITPISDTLFKFIPTQHDFYNPRLLAFKIAKSAILILIAMGLARGIKAALLKIRKR